MKDNHKTIMITLIIVAVLLVSGAIFAMFWGITSHRGGVIQNHIESVVGDKML